MRTEQKKDPNLIKNCERLAGPINAVAFSADGNFFVAGSSGEARVFKKDGSRVAMLAGISGAVNAVEFSPDGAKVFAAGFDGKVRLFDARDGKLILEFVPEPWAKVTPTR